MSLPQPVDCGIDVASSQLIYHSLAEGAPDAMVVVASDGRIVLVNRQTEHLFGYPRAELLGRAIEILIPQRFHPHHAAHRNRYLSEPRLRLMSSGLELYGLRKDGSEFPVEISLSPLQTPEGLLVCSAIRDGTDRKNAALALELANHELEAFSYSVAHDLRAPLRGMNGFAQVLLEDYDDKLDAEGRGCLHEIHKNTLRMGTLIDALLSLSKVARSALALDQVNITAVARAIAAQLQAAEPQREVVVQIEDSLEAHADPVLVRILLDNLLANAWKFSNRVASARIELGARSEQGQRVFFVRDNGAGFDPKYADKLFAPFQRLHTIEEFAGTGIGLATAQRIVRRHGGRIWAEGKVGAGATFYFTLSA